MKTDAASASSPEWILDTGRYIVSTADAGGCITFANDVLVEYSGYGRDELLGKPHSLLRHPDMPRAVFRLVWETLADGESFSGYLKNLRKDGGYYWVFAHIQPEYYGNGELKGYRSVRRAPRREALPPIAELYARMRAAERAAENQKEIEAGLAVLTEHLMARGQSYEQMVAML